MFCYMELVCEIMNSLLECLQCYNKLCITCYSFVANFCPAGLTSYQLTGIQKINFMKKEAQKNELLLWEATFPAQGFTLLSRQCDTSPLLVSRSLGVGGIASQRVRRARVPPNCRVMGPTFWQVSPQVQIAFFGTKSPPK